VPRLTGLRPARSRQGMAGLLGLCLLVGWVPSVPASGFHPFGFPALLQTPVARLPQEGTLSFGVTRILPYDTLYLSGSPFDWLNVSFYYVDTNLPLTRTNTRHDKGLSVHVKLFDESLWRPAAALGFADLGGTGLFASEYLVFNKRIYDLDVSAGLGWGRLGSSGDFRNPAIGLSDRFERRDGSRQGGGRPTVSNWFSGEEVAFFGGFRYSPGNGPWTFLLEWEGNDYSDEVEREDELQSASRLNGGFSYRFRNGITLKSTYERGNTLGFGLSIQPDLGMKSRREARLRRPAQPLNPPAFRLPEAGDTLETPEQRLRAFHQNLRGEGIFVQAIDFDAEQRVVSVWHSQSLTDETAVAVGRISRALINHYPGRFDTFRITEVAGGQDVSTVTVLAQVFEQAANGKRSVEELALVTSIEAPQPSQRREADHPQLARYPAFAYGVTPALRSNIGGRQAFYAGQLLVKPYASFQMTRNLHASVRWAFDSGLNNLDVLQPARTTDPLPPVRSDLEFYQTTNSGSYLDRLELNYLFTLAPEVYGRFSAGIFEEMYGGIAHELLYKPVDSRLAIGYNVNRVRKRDFDQRFRFQDYEVTTGHVTAYYESPFNRIRVILSAGRYLAGDVGATLDVSKSFRNGFRLGGFASKTNVSSRDFGEGSFDKGLYLYIPIDLLSSVRGAGGLSIQHRFLTRDGAAKVRDGRALYPVFDNTGAAAFLRAPDGLLQ
jgi:hypothetical protein